MKKIELLFYPTNPSKENIGMKIVLWEVTVDKQVIHDWGFAYWGGESWDALASPDGVTAVVSRWSNTPDPEVLLKEPSKIIKL